MEKPPIGLFGYGHIITATELSGFGSDGGKSNIGIKSIIAGGIAGAAQLLVTYPIEYVKTQVQLDEKGKTMYSGSWDCTKQTWNKSGIVGFYRGMGITLCGYIHKVGVRFYVLELMRTAFENSAGQLTTNMKLLSGMAAGTVEAIFAVTPFETLKTKFIHDERRPIPQYRGIIHGVTTIIKNEGFSGVYKGLTPTILKEGTNQAIRFSVVETLKEIYTDGDSTKYVPMAWTALFGGIGGAASVVCNTPIDVIKTRMQGLEAARYKNTWHCTKIIWIEDGPIGFYKGLVPRGFRVSVDVAITFMVYDKFMELLTKIA